MAYLDKINSPEDLKKLNTAEMEALAGEIRSAVLNRDSKIGGHVGPNLGIVETAIALHYVFDSPKDKIVYDVSHQSYPHKILTGRKNGFLKGQTDQNNHQCPGEKVRHIQIDFRLLQMLADGAAGGPDDLCGDA